MSEPLEIHLLNATGRLRPVVSFLHSRIRAAVEETARHLPLGPLDVVVEAGPRVIPEKGAVGYTPHANAIFVTVDPDNPALVADENRAFERMIAHELHHAVRWTGPGYGTHLGEGLISEGLACRFVREVYGPPFEPWEKAFHPFDLAPHRDAALERWDKAYNHPRWFMGTGDLPRWLGYSLGTDLVERHLADHPHDSATGLVHADADRFRPSA
ncbi:hypothetical protein PARPLA_00414 [Rhodobacteraceae bacterium THAF1]|uniref:DUF2268 domain-containing putative Zn-dependent protease n=1 Tax=Palleronia sp. THAF1 TaxID=2587842 RepID=UPI000F40127A|nr:DUF2268 domain-containing putative Zn-dependent protease [Palleronia sp. THAF1]QFU10023.1 hypothetical protein FIU81_15190 [Palleronia sp. THAF1]VDC17072.1 hypothetical protein PARPLA_00414 [Rhodobacteraceae bacterium THAF1]